MFGPQSFINGGLNHQSLIMTSQPLLTRPSQAAKSLRELQLEEELRIQRDYFIERELKLERKLLMERELRLEREETLMQELRLQKTLLASMNTPNPATQIPNTRIQTPTNQEPSKAGHSNLSNNHAISPMTVQSSSSSPVTPAKDDQFTSVRFEGQKLLPESFRPSSFSVICGRGKKCYHSLGNVRLRELVKKHAAEYSKAKTIAAKSQVVRNIINQVKSACPMGTGAFVKQASNETPSRWYEVSDHVARERVTSLFRDFLHSDYASSSASRIYRRRQAKFDLLDRDKSD